MIKCEALEKFTLGEFKKLKNIQRKAIDTEGTLYPGDTFDCDEEMAKYLTGGNNLKKVVVKVIEVLPKEEPKIIETIETPLGTFGYGPVEIKETKPKKKKTSKK